jgi:hypothetical protein
VAEAAALMLYDGSEANIVDAVAEAAAPWFRYGGWSLAECYRLSYGSPYENQARLVSLG